MNVYFQVVNITNVNHSRVGDYKTEEEAIAKCEEGFGADYMSNYHLTYRKVWTNLKGSAFNKLFK